MLECSSGCNKAVSHEGSHDRAQLHGLYRPFRRRGTDRQKSAGHAADEGRGGSRQDDSILQSPQAGSQKPPRQDDALLWCL